ncbi:MAG: hypothetical protein HY716_08605 [Planctomycetes bacterium]|nr:hypothetical protein [Planctomycetota bacterium]
MDTIKTSAPAGRSLTLGRVFWFWLPLGSMWLLMNVEQPLCAAVVARLPDAVRSLAAFGLAFSLAVFLESPIVSLLTAGNALAVNRASYARLLGFTHAMNAVLFGLHLTIGLTPMYQTIVCGWIGAPESLLPISRTAFLLMAPCTPLVAYRRLWQGVLIRHHRPGKVAAVMVVRLAAMLLALVAGLLWGRWPGAYVGTAAISVGVAAGALAAWIFARPYLSSGGSGRSLSWNRLLSFYTPLGLTGVIHQSVEPILFTAMSHAALPLESLATWPVMIGLVGILIGMGRAQQEITVALLNDRSSFIQLRRFSSWLAFSMTCFMAMVALTPVGSLWFETFSGLKPELARLAEWPAILFAIVPGLAVFRSWWRGVLIQRHRTTPVGIGTALNVAVLLIFSWAGVAWNGAPGIVVAAAAYAFSVGAECLYLGWQSRLAMAGAEGRIEIDGATMLKEEVV